MLAVVTPEEMAAIDRAAPEPVEVLIARAGAATARAALGLLGGSYGRRVVVVAGKGNNGNDGRDAAARLARRGVRVTVVPAEDAPAVLPPADLVVDAAFGTGFRGDYTAPAPGPFPSGRGASPAPVLAVDIPSGVDGLTGEVSGTPIAATRTVTFAALKPGLLFHPGRDLAGEVTVADIGLDVSQTRAGVVEQVDVAGWVPGRPPVAHKWQSALLLAAGSEGMPGAAALAASGAQRAGAGMVRYLLPGAAAAQPPQMPVEAVGVPAAEGLPAADDMWDRVDALVVGPGMGTDDGTLAAVRQIVAAAPGHVGVLVDGDGLTALGNDAPDLLLGRRSPAVLTPHDGEYARLAGSPPGADRCRAARDLAGRTGAIVLLKGPTTVVAHPDGRVRIVTTGDQRLATAGTGDVLSGIVGALLAQGVLPFDAAAAGAWLHGEAARQMPACGLVASDIVAALPAVLASDLPPGGGRTGAGPR